jgi:hypothetical protein
MHILTKLQLADVIGGVAGRTQAPTTVGGQKVQQHPLEAQGNQPIEAKPLPFIAPANPAPQITGFQPVIGQQRLGGSMPVPEQAQKA